MCAVEKGISGDRERLSEGGRFGVLGASKKKFHHHSLVTGTEYQLARVLVR
jgi:hypothetical protein